MRAKEVDNTVGHRVEAVPGGHQEVPVAQVIQGQDALGRFHAVECPHGFVVRDQYVNRPVHQQQRRGAGEIIAATAERGGGCGQGRGGSDALVAATAVGNDAQRGDAAIGVPEGADVAGIDLSIERRLGCGVGGNHRVDQEADIARLVLRVGGVGPGGRIAAGQRIQGATTTKPAAATSSINAS